MPYKNNKVQKEYQKIWYQRKRKGLPTKFKPRKKLSPEKLEAMKMTWDKEYQARRRKFRNLLKLKHLGNSCTVCKTKKATMIAHKKNFKKHKDFNLMSNSEYEKELKSKKYVLLCYSCHKGVHWSNKFLGVKKWEDFTFI
jgi:hypothetical protein